MGQPKDDPLETLRNLGVQVEDIPEVDRSPIPFPNIKQSGQQNQERIFNQQPDILKMAMEETLGSSNRNAEKPYGSEFLDDSSNPFDNDLPTPGIDENIENNPQDTENIPVNTENFPGNLGNNPLENEKPPSSSNEDIENNYQGTGNIPVNTDNVPDNPGSTPLENDVSTTSTEQTTGISENYP